jgi:hypothetical protein
MAGRKRPFTSPVSPAHSAIAASVRPPAGSSRWMRVRAVCQAGSLCHGRPAELQAEKRAQLFGAPVQIQSAMVWMSAAESGVPFRGIGLLPGHMPTPVSLFMR